MHGLSLSHILLSAILILALTPCLAQQGLHMGLRILPQATSLRNTDDADAQPAVYDAQPSYGFGIGLSSLYMVNNYLGFGSNLLYSSRGQAYSYQYTTSSGASRKVNNELRIRQLQMPLLARLGTNSSRRVAGFLELGPQFGFIVSAKEDSDDTRFRATGPPFVTYTQYPDRIETLSRFQLAGVLGAGAEFKLRYNVKLNTSLRIEYGFSDVEDKGARYTQVDFGVAQNLLYYETPRPDGPQYKPGRPATTALVTSLVIGIDYVFIPKFRP
ncbi:MAG: porin family protein [Sphingobacteriia bacterium]|jgi:hypothetical protein